MSRPTTIKLPALDLSAAKVSSPLRARGRSGSIVKVEEVSDRFVDTLDRGAYVNINANWVNAKGQPTRCQTIPFALLTLLCVK